MVSIGLRLKNGKFGQVTIHNGFIAIKGESFFTRKKIAKIVREYANEKIRISLSTGVNGFYYNRKYDTKVKNMLSSYLCKFFEQEDLS